MIDKDGLVSQAELELRTTRTISLSFRQAWEALPRETKSAFDRAMMFLGCPPNGKPGTPPFSTSEADRVAAARLMLLKLGLDGDDPRWSSDVLERLLNAVVETPNGSVGDLFRALFDVLGDYSPDLTKPVANLLKDLVINCFTRQRRSYESVEWRRLAESITGKATQAQLYLALHAIPPQFVSPQLASAIAKGLENTAYHGEAIVALAG